MFIYSIKPARSTNGEYRFQVVFSTGHVVEMEAVDLTSYERFRAKVLTATGRGCHYLPPDLPDWVRDRCESWAPSRSEWENAVNTWLAAGRKGDDGAGNEELHFAA